LVTPSYLILETYTGIKFADRVPEQILRDQI